MTGAAGVATYGWFPAHRHPRSRGVKRDNRRRRSNSPGSRQPLYPKDVNTASWTGRPGSERGAGDENSRDFHPRRRSSRSSAIRELDPARILKEVRSEGLLPGEHDCTRMGQKWTSLFGQPTGRSFTRRPVGRTRPVAAAPTVDGVDDPKGAHGHMATLDRPRGRGGPGVGRRPLQC